MAGQLISNFTDALTARAADLAAAPDQEAVQTIVRAARREAVAETVPNTFVYKATVIVLGFAVIAVVVAQLWITLQTDKPIPEGLIAIGSAAIGALAGLLAPQPAS